MWMWLLMILFQAYCPTAVSQNCNVTRAGTCIEDFKTLYETTLLNEKRTTRETINLCAYILTNNDITKCVEMGTKGCNSTTAQPVEDKWSELRDIVNGFCDNECMDYSNIKICLHEIDYSAIKRGQPSSFCRTYKESKECVKPLEDDCEFIEELFEYVQEKYYVAYFQNVCLADCSNVDESSSIITSCYPRLQGADPENQCPTHHNFTECLYSFENAPCPQFHVLIPDYYYDYRRMERLCPKPPVDMSDSVTSCDVVGSEACFMKLQAQYDATFETYLRKTFKMPDLKDLCLIPIRGSNVSKCYEDASVNCTDMTSFPVHYQWEEVINNIKDLCDVECPGVTKAEQCCASVDYSAFYKNSWTSFCSSYKTATGCIRDLNCSLGNEIFTELLNPDANEVIENICKSGCPNMTQSLPVLENCYPLLSLTSISSDPCPNFMKFLDCMNSAGIALCSQIDDIIAYLSPNFTEIITACWPMTTEAPEMTTEREETTIVQEPTTVKKQTIVTELMTTQREQTTFKMKQTTTKWQTVSTPVTIQTDQTTDKSTAPSHKTTITPVPADVFKRCFPKDLIAGLSESNKTDLKAKICIEIMTAVRCLTGVCDDIEKLAHCIRQIPDTVLRDLNNSLSHCNAKLHQQIKDHIALARNSTLIKQRYSNFTCTGNSAESKEHSSIRFLIIAVTIVTVLIPRVSS